MRGGVTVGETDELGYHVVRDAVGVNDLHATMLWLLGVDHERLTWRFQGREYRLTDVAGRGVRGVGPATEPEPAQAGDGPGWFSEAGQSVMAGSPDLWGPGVQTDSPDRRAP